MASRLESSGVLGRIQVSEQVAQILTKNGEYEVECRGPIEVKGKGRLTTYLVKTPFDSVDNEHSESPFGSPKSQQSLIAEDLSPAEQLIAATSDDEVEELGADA